MHQANRARRWDLGCRFGCVIYRDGLKSKPEKVAPSEVSKAELALDLAGWKPALLEGGIDAFL